MLNKAMWSTTISCAGNEPPRTEAEQSWQLYLPLWSALIGGKGQPADADADVSAWAQPTYDSLMSAVLDALRNLDLDYQQDQGMEAAAQAGRLADTIEVGCAALYLCSSINAKALAIAWDRSLLLSWRPACTCGQHYRGLGHQQPCRPDLYTMPTPNHCSALH